MKLVIVESPTKAKTISKFLGKDYTVESSFGHVRDLPKSKMGIDIEGGTFEPTYDISKDKTKQVKKLKDLAKKANEIIFATDEDREGEAISWHLAYILGVEPAKAKRIAFHEITKHAIEEALAHPRNIDQKLVDAQQTRRILDRLVGYELSPFLWKKVARGLSAGRVQSVAVRLIVERERERRAFKEEEYWTIEAVFNKQQKNSQQFIGKLHSIDNKKLDKLEINNQEKADKILSDLKDAQYQISKISAKETLRTPSPPFTTSTLQQQASHRCGYSAKQTMRLAQQLYEGVKIPEHGQTGLITYMRTDSLNLSDKFLSETKNFIEKEYTDKYSLKTPRIYKTKSKGAQEAHEAIRPANPAWTPVFLANHLDDQQLKLYTLIWKRAVATQMPEARLDRTSIDTTVKKYMFRTSGQMIVFPGWLKLYPEQAKEEMLPELSEGDHVDCQELKPEQHYTQPPARYSDATLVKILEEYGIGRPSTYSPTISTIENRGYVERDENKKLAPLDIAFIVNDLLVEHFPEIVDYQFTAQMENNLDDIAEGKKDWQPIISTFYHPFHKNLVDKTENLTKKETVGMREIGIDPKSGKPIYARVGRYGAFVQKGSKDDEEKPIFAKLAKGQMVDTVTLEDALQLFKLPRVVGNDKNGHEVIANIGKFGPYVKANEKFYSIKEDDPYTIKIEKALEIIAIKKKADDEKTIKTFEGSEIQILNGRYGPYITDPSTKTNAKIPKDKEPTDLTLEECETQLKENPTKKRGGSRKKK
ncbi:MAG: type I DNA topoisomerase [Candidatus Magasanikbacteria bacterium CG_4_10_14_0_2_um_filter_37_12]|uniref:DNA topoisomerase 1 n=1 Tax=Candidatus Magasanikbacteria bacterium CG_4_10_14_0_2_um_filter_37_12 TaxID=1974637 RepID=A0A2M7V7K0_9BACT|nr:MAG: type I DNA topoisomerase [Candidatus Magasanikbacteria bacterium CG_4_10_14_0_2_um_filter_37_12]